MLLMVFNSQHAHDSLGWTDKQRNDFISNIEKHLIENKDQITIDTFGKICFGLQIHHDI